MRFQLHFNGHFVSGLGLPVTYQHRSSLVHLLYKTAVDEEGDKFVM